MRVTNVHTVPVTDINGNTKNLAVGTEDGHVVGNYPGWFRIDFDNLDKHIAHLELVRDAARKQVRRDR